MASTDNPLEQQLPVTLEMAYVLFMDIVGYSVRPMEQQTRDLDRLQLIVRSTTEFRQAEATNDLISLPTGDGMALVFFRDPVSAVRCAVEICRTLRENPGIELRIGIHSGPVCRMDDINANHNVSGGGINIAQRVMDCGDAGHVLISRSVAEILGELGSWRAHLHDLGEHSVKHGVRIHLFNLCTEHAGNCEIPQKLKAVSAAIATGGPARPTLRRKWWIALALAAPAVAFLATDKAAEFFRYMSPSSEKVLAVLPFQNLLGADSANEAFCAGLFEILTNKLTQFESFQGSLRVVSAGDVLKVRASSAREARQAFGVNLVLMGSVQHPGGKLVVTLNLVDPRTATQLRARSPEIQASDISSMQDRVVAAVAEMLDLEIHPAQRQILSAGVTCRFELHNGHGERNCANVACCPWRNDRQ